MNNLLEKIAVKMAIERIKKSLGDKAEREPEKDALKVLEEFVDMHYRLTNAIEETAKELLDGLFGDEND